MFKIVSVAAIVAVILGVLAIVFLPGASQPEMDPPEVVGEIESEIPVVEKREIPPPEPEVTENYALSGELPNLDSSDESLFNHLRLLVTPVRLRLLEDDQFLRKLVLQIDNASRGELVYQHSPLVSPEETLGILETEDGLKIDSDSYQRYEPYIDLMESIDTSLLVAYYQYYEPLLEEAYAELGYPPEEFRGTFIEAIDSALGVPVVEGDIVLIQPEINYQYEDPTLEGLSPMQKQILRMGPENTMTLQLVLQRFKARIQ